MFKNQRSERSVENYDELQDLNGNSKNYLVYNICSLDSLIVVVVDRINMNALVDTGAVMNIIHQDPCKGKKTIH